MPAEDRDPDDDGNKRNACANDRRKDDRALMFRTAARMRQVRNGRLRLVIHRLIVDALRDVPRFADRVVVGPFRLRDASPSDGYFLRTAFRTVE